MARRPLGLFVKRLIDLTGAAVGLVLLSPILLGVAAWIVVAEGGPVFFRQVRVGQGGKLFTIVKFRTMVPDAEERFLDVAPLNDHEGAAFKMDNDPRVTGLGRILRRTSIDELPQLWNVLFGEMSLVGPRPAPPREVADYQAWHYERLMVKPGITGAWQVTARLDNSFDRRAELDIDYVRNWSLARDLVILLKTLPAVFRQTGR
jgi:lipopolysaccharide/colanic/teichoic acid biosynthesis glycosyltransferase